MHLIHCSDSFVGHGAYYSSPLTKNTQDKSHWSCLKTSRRRSPAIWGHNGSLWATPWKKPYSRVSIRIRSSDGSSHLYSYTNNMQGFQTGRMRTSHLYWKPKGRPCLSADDMSRSTFRGSYWNTITVSFSFTNQHEINVQVNMRLVEVVSMKVGRGVFP